MIVRCPNHVPNHPDSQSSPEASVLVGARLYCVPCALFLKHDANPRLALDAVYPPEVGPRVAPLCANPGHGPSCCYV